MYLLDILSLTLIIILQLQTHNSNSDRIFHSTTIFAKPIRSAYPFHSLSKTSPIDTPKKFLEKLKPFSIAIDMQPVSNLQVSFDYSETSVFLELSSRIMREDATRVTGPQATRSRDSLANGTSVLELSNNQNRIGTFLQAVRVEPGHTGSGILSRCGAACG